MTLRERLAAAADAVDAARDELGRLDAVAGDGDHGVTMALGARAVRQALAASPDASGAELFGNLAIAMGSVGGAIGPIYASGLIAIASTLRGWSQDEPPSVAQLLACAEAAEAAIVNLGRARPGDKTIVDALEPAVGALRQALATGAGVDEALGAAAAAAQKGAAGTAAMIASAGRASRLGEKSRGSPDAGATSFALIMSAVSASRGRPPRSAAHR